MRHRDSDYNYNYRSGKKKHLEIGKSNGGEGGGESSRRGGANSLFVLRVESTDSSPGHFVLLCAAAAQFFGVWVVTDRQRSGA